MGLCLIFQVAFVGLRKSFKKAKSWSLLESGTGEWNSRTMLAPQHYDER